HDQLRRIADQGYSTLLMPDVPGWQTAPAIALAAGGSRTRLRVGTGGYAAPWRPAWSTAGEAHSLTELTGGRFDLGIGTGRPGRNDLVRDPGDKGLTPAERIH